MVSVDYLRLLKVGPDAHVTTHADLSGIATYFLNDMVVDSLGRAYVGNVGFCFLEEPLRPAALARVDPDGTVHKAADDLMLPNGSVITPDGGTLILVETAAARLTAFDIDPDGSLSNRRLWAPLKASADGICLDAEGAKEKLGGVVDAVSFDVGDEPEVKAAFEKYQRFRSPRHDGRGPYLRAANRDFGRCRRSDAGLEVLGSILCVAGYGSAAARGQFDHLLQRPRGGSPRSRHFDRVGGERSTGGVRTRAGGRTGTGPRQLRLARHY